MGWVDSRSQRIWTRGAARNAAMQRTKFNPFAFPISVLPGCAFALWISVQNAEGRIYVMIV